MNTRLCIEGLKISLKKPQKILVSNISFSASAGESVILLGQSGSGKTMTCRAVIGLLERNKFSVSGSIQLDGQELISLSPRDKRSIYGGEIAFIPQNPMTALDPSMRVGKQMDETLSLHSTLSKAARWEHILTALSNTGLTDVERIYSAYPYMLSGGMLQRILIAMASMTEAKLIIADEPTTALDVVHRNETIDAFRTLRQGGAAVFMVTHDFAAAVGLGGHLMIMKDGQILESGDADTVLVAPKNVYTRALIEASALSASGLGGNT